MYLGRSGRHSQSPFSLSLSPFFVPRSHRVLFPGDREAESRDKDLLFPTGMCPPRGPDADFGDKETEYRDRDRPIRDRDVPPSRP